MAFPEPSTSCSDVCLTAPLVVSAGVQAPSLDNLLVNDVVQCFVRVKKAAPDKKCPFICDPVFRLELFVHLPQDCGFAPYFWRGPRVIMATYEGEEGYMSCPEWVSLVGRAGKTFFQLRTLMVEVIATLARQETQTQGKARRILDWCKCISRVTLDAIQQPEVHPPTSRVLLPRRVAPARKRGLS